MINEMNGVIFDMDGTLIDSLGIWYHIWDTFGKKFLGGKTFNITEADDKAVRTMRLKDAMDYLHAQYSIGSSGSALLSLAEQIISDFYLNQVELKQGVREFLEFCYASGVKMCIASASDLHLIHLAIDHCDIRKYFVGIVSCAEFGGGKDKPDIYLKAMDLLGTSLQDTWVVEDSHVAIKTASSLGMKTIGVYDPYNFGYDEIEKLSTVCIGKGESFKKLLES